MVMEKPLAACPEPCGKEHLNYNAYQIPFEIEEEDLNISLEREGDRLLYHRQTAGDTLDKTILAANGSILFNPVEPVNKPREITQFYLVELEHNITVKPRETSEIALTFPVEIGAFFRPDEQAHTVLDIFSFVKAKYTLYGTPRNGLICRYWKSRIHATLPTPNPLFEGVMRLSIRNTTPRWIELTKAVFNAHDMIIFYNRDMVFADAYLKINSESTAETGFDNKPLHHNMEKSLELFTSKKNIVSVSRLIMEEGL